MSDTEFAAACAAIETIALNNQLMLERHYGTTRADVQEVVSMAKAEWFRSGRSRKEAR